jgi:poly(3-hydroxybutyrate) depolymerase
VKGERVRPQDIKTTALLTIEGEFDDISGAGQTRAAHDLCTGVNSSRKFHYDAVGAGHYGIFSGRRWREKIYPQVRDFIASHQTRSTAAATAAVKKGTAVAVSSPARKSAAKAPVAKAVVAKSTRKPAAKAPAAK